MKMEPIYIIQNMLSEMIYPNSSLNRIVIKMAETDKLTPEQLKMLKEITSDGVVTKTEFDIFAADMIADGKKTQAEISTLTDLFRQSLVNAKSIDEKMELTSKYEASVPAGTFEIVMKTIQDGEIKKTKFQTLLMITIVLGFLLSTLLSALGIGQAP